ncbi:MAG TPA: protein-L-isoaspartate(D-aspartate) O-methyltransferase, partial [Rhodothermales bacterium]|nr:protein-L-isoaspartate(D-aspartate) O-methyltransferase [Rhodothermales bacterium]
PRRQRLRLVDELRDKGISDERVLAAISRVPRHLFVEPALRARAYRDEALPIGLKQTISQPFTVAYQTMVMNVRRDDTILEIGTGSGYQAAILCELGARVYSIERHKPLLDRTRALLDRLGYRIVTRHGDGTLGWEAFAPYDGVVVTAGALEIPDALLAQLRVPDNQTRGGRLIIPLGDDRGQIMNRIDREDANQFKRQRLDSFRFVPLIGGNAR